MRAALLGFMPSGLSALLLTFSRPVRIAVFAKLLPSGPVVGSAKRIQACGAHAWLSGSGLPGEVSLRRRDALWVSFDVAGPGIRGAGFDVRGAQCAASCSILIVCMSCRVSTTV